MFPWQHQHQQAASPAPVLMHEKSGCEENNNSTDDAVEKVSPTNDTTTNNASSLEDEVGCPSPTMAAASTAATMSVTTTPSNWSNPDDRLLGRFVEHLQRANVNVALPQIVVMGETSAGKSSLLSQLCGIELPAHATLTTRCPTQICLQHTLASVKKATVSILWRTNFPGAPPTFDRTITSDFAVTIPAVLTEAQQLILDTTALTVAPDIILLHVYDPAWSSLSLTLIDLPGTVVATGTHEDGQLAPAVANLHDTYWTAASSQRTIVVAVIPCHVDFHNVALLARAQQQQPPHTVVPVLTKPDLVDPGAETSVLALLHNRSVTLPAGYHIIKCRGQAALDAHQSIPEALRHEAHYFATTAPWNTKVDVAMRGTVALRTKLATWQYHLLQQAVPEIVQELQQQQQIMQNELAALGPLLPSTADRRARFQQWTQMLLASWTATLSGKNKGGQNSGRVNAERSAHFLNGATIVTNDDAPPPPAAAVHRLHTACQAFATQLQHGTLATIATLREGEDVWVTTARGALPGELVHLDADYCCVECVNVRDLTSNVLYDATGLQLEHHEKEHLEPDTVWSDGQHVYIARKNDTYDRLRKLPLRQVRPNNTAWLRRKLDEHRTNDLTCFLNVDTFTSIVRDFIASEWQPAGQELLRAVRAVVLNAIECGLDEASSCLAQSRYPEIYRLVQQQCQVTAENLLASAQQQVEEHLDMEKHPFTQDQALLDNIVRARHDRLRQELHAALRLDNERVVFDTPAIRTIVDEVLDRHTITNGHDNNVAAHDHMAHELELVLASYGQLATRRVVDRMPMVCWQTTRALIPALQSVLWQVTDETLDAHLRDDPTVVARHAELRTELAKLDEALQIMRQARVRNIAKDTIERDKETNSKIFDSSLQHAHA